jgi:hypothetical protein
MQLLYVGKGIYTSVVAGTSVASCCILGCIYEILYAHCSDRGSPRLPSHRNQSHAWIAIPYRCVVPYDGPLSRLIM